MNLLQSASIIGSNLTFPNPTQIGSLLIVLVYGAAQDFSCRDSIGNKYQSNPVRSQTSVFAQVFFVRNRAAGMNSVAVAGSAITALAIHEFSGVNTLDTASYAIGTGNAQVSGPITTNFAPELLFGYEANLDNPLALLPGVGWTVMEQIGQQALTQYQIVTDKGAFNSSSSTSTFKGGIVNWIEEIISFYDIDFKPGQLYPSDIAYPPAQQPGGLGTPVTDPTQKIGPTTNTKPDLLFPMNEFTGRFRPGCGHSINSYEIIEAAVNGAPAALICCPLCRFIQRIITPYDAIHDDLINQIIIG